MSTSSANFHYNPDWLGDDALVANFVARQNDFSFLRDELARAPLQGTAQHYLLVGVRGAGKTTLLKRLAVAIRSDADLKDHLIALSFPEELYEVKNLADFWWVCCVALVDELDRSGQSVDADRLMSAVEQSRRIDTDSLADGGLKLLLETCTAMGRRPVLLVDNLDLLFERIDKKGRKLKDPHAPAYWALREALSTTSSPIVIGGSVRLSEPFTDYDKAFYDFFLPKRLGKLSLDEVRTVLDRLADAQNTPEVKERLRARPSRVEALYDLTGGNPRAIGLIFELLRQGPNGRAIDDFQRLMDITTPYYKARFEDLSEQAQVVMHALAVRRPSDGSGLRFGHTAAEIGAHAGLPTGTISAQMDVLDREGLVEKSADHGRTQYRISEQLFRLWLQMRSNRRIRQNVIGLSEFLEAMYDVSELTDGLQQQSGSYALADAQLSFAVADTSCTSQLRRGLEAHGAGRLLQHVQDHGGKIDDFLPQEDLPEDLGALVRLREQLGNCRSAGLSADEQDALIGSLVMSLQQKRERVTALCLQLAPSNETAKVRELLAGEALRLRRDGLLEADLPLLFNVRAMGYLPLPGLTPEDVETACTLEQNANLLRSAAWRLLGARRLVRLSDDAGADEWLKWAQQHAVSVSSGEWANVASTCRRSGRLIAGRNALDHALPLGTSARAWFEKGNLTMGDGINFAEAESAFHKAIELDPGNAMPWNSLGTLLSDKLARYDEAESAYRKAIELDPAYAAPWDNLGNLLGDKLSRYEEAEMAYRKAITLDTACAGLWNNLGNLLGDKLARYEEAENAYRKALELDPQYAWTWNNLGLLLEAQNRLDEAADAYSRGEKAAGQYPYWEKRRNELQTRRYTIVAQQALDAGNASALREVLVRVLEDSRDVAAAVVSKVFVEGFLGPALASGQNAATLVGILRDLGYEKRARPLMLAIEAVIGNCPEKLADIEPETQSAARHMFDRLTAHK